MRKDPVAEGLEGRLLMAVTPGPEFRVNTHTADTQAFPATAMDADGDFVVTWQSRAQDDPPSVGEGVYAQRYDAAGVPQGGEFRVSTTGVSNQTKPRGGMGAGGDFVIGGKSRGGGASGISARLFDAAGVARGGEFRVNTYQTGFQTLPTVAMDAAGDFV